MMKNYQVPYWVIICCHLAMAGGTMAGGWRIIKTMGQRITQADTLSADFAPKGGRDYAARYGTLRYTRQHHSHDYRSNRWSRILASTKRGALGRHAQHSLGVASYDSRCAILGAILFKALAPHSQIINPYELPTSEHRS